MHYALCILHFIRKDDFMAISEARKRANAKYNLKAYDRIELKVAKGKKEEIRAGVAEICEKFPLYK